MEYERLRGEILEDLEDEKVAVKEDLRRLYYSSFFNAPERLPVVYREVVQGAMQVSNSNEKKSESVKFPLTLSLLRSKAGKWEHNGD